MKATPDRLLRIFAAIGAVLWLGFVADTHPQPFERSWAVALLLLAPATLVPLALRLIERVDPEPVPVRLRKALLSLQLPAVLSLAGALRRPPTALAGMLAVPWLVVTLFIAAGGARRVAARGLRASLAAPELLAVDVARLLLPVGAAWTVLACAGVRPLGFEDVIVLLTGVHFHYAGFLLPLLAGLATRELPGRAARLACWGVMAGVPLVAAGITARQVGAGSLLEVTAAWITAPAALLVAWLHLRLATRRGERLSVRLAWTGAALALIMGAAFAAAYGARAFFDLRALDIPWMRVLHGTPNALGFGVLGVLGWTLRGSMAAGERGSEAAPRGRR